jgi:hypothetical protein
VGDPRHFGGIPVTGGVLCGPDTGGNLGTEEVEYLAHQPGTADLAKLFQR